MFIHISLLIGAILSILVLIVSVVYLIMQNRNTKSALDASSFNINKFSLDEILSNSNVTSAYVNELLTKVNCVIGKHEEAKTKISELQEEIESHIAVGNNLTSACRYLQERLNAYLNADENQYTSKQALLPEMQQDSVTMFNLIDYLRKYSDVFTASELLDEWDTNKRQRSMNEYKEFDAFNSAIDRETFAKDVSSFLQKVKSRQPFQKVLECPLITLNGDFDEHIISCVIQSILLELGFVNNPPRYPTKPYNYGLSYPEITEKHEFFGFVSERDNTKQFILAFRLTK